jgi:hypothetical protein
MPYDDRLAPERLFAEVPVAFQRRRMYKIEHYRHRSRVGLRGNEVVSL